MIIKGTATSLVLFIFVIIVLALVWSRRIKLPKPKWFPAVDKIPEIVGRCTETNRPVFSDPGRFDAVTSPRGVVGVAGIAILSYVAKLCAKYNTKFVVFSQNVAILSWITETMKAPYLQYPNSVKPEVRYIPPVLGNVYEITVQLQMEREKAGGFISLGPLLSSAAIVAEGAAKAGAVSLMGTDVMESMSFMAIACDYVMIGEEIYTAAALVTEDEIAQFTVTVQDITKAIFVAIIILGGVLSTLGISWITNLLRT